MPHSRHESRECAGVHSGHLLCEGDLWLFGKVGVMGFFYLGQTGMDVPGTIYRIA